ncbi:MAG TPA: hypothetical protein VN255_17705 [Mycobacterium sp.]|nr:hypothetical protein [Mycobacterium sp.]HWT50318.1 hypothetical protein [Mycobacterium sp.]
MADLLGSGFTLFTGSAGAAWVRAARPGVGIPWRLDRRHTIGVASETTEIADVDGRWAELTRLAPDGALLVRPDDLIGWRAEGLPPAPEESLQRVLCQILGRH